MPCVQVMSSQGVAAPQETCLCFLPFLLSSSASPTLILFFYVGGEGIPWFGESPVDTKLTFFSLIRLKLSLGSTIWTSRIQPCFQLVHASPVLTCKQNSTYAQFYRFPQPITVVSYSIPAEWIRMPEWPTSEARLEDAWYLFCNQMLLIDLGHEGIKISKCIVRCSTIGGQLISRNKTVSILPQKECASC